MDSAKRNIILDEPVDSKIQSVSLDCQHDLTLGTEQEYSNGHQYIILQRTGTTP
jgi:hypothetical protein